MIVQEHDPSQMPPLGDLTTQTLINHLLGAKQVGRIHPMMERRGATLDDLRREVERREKLGAEVRP